MSTRCQIGFYPAKNTPIRKFEALIYRHSDGYPDGPWGVIASLKGILKRAINSDSGSGLSDPEHIAAWTLHHMLQSRLDAQKRAYARFYSRYAKRAKTAKTADLRKHAREMMAYYTPARVMDFLGYGICGDRQIHEDVAYFYMVYPNGIKVYEVKNPARVNSWKLLQTVEL